MKDFFSRFILFFTSITLAFICLFHGVDRAGSAFHAKDPDGIKMNAVVVSDLHAADKLTNDRDIILAKLFSGITKSETKLDAIALPGDITNNATKDEYRCLSAIINRYVRTGALLPALGNHDVRGDMNVEDYDDNMDRFYSFCALMGVETDKPYYAKVVQGYSFIVLGSEAEVKDRTYISPEQLQWLDGELTIAEAGGNPAFIICHQVIDHTNNVDQVWRFDGSIGEQSDAVRDVIRSHTDNGLKVVFISGHLHEDFSEYSFEQPWPNLYCLNLPSAQFNEPAGMGCTVEAYADCVLIRTRNFITGEWLQTVYTVPLQ